MPGIQVAAEPRLRGIDALRAIAALLVLWQHVAEVYVRMNGAVLLAGSWLADLADSLNFGRIGVVAFFLVSGFVIPFSMQPGQPAAVRTFVIKRFFRLFPAYWLSVPLGALTGYWIWGHEFGLADFLVNLTLLQDVFGMRPAEGLYWTLLMELVFYGLCVVLLLTHSLDNPRRLLALAWGLGLMHVVAMVAIRLGLPLSSTAVAFGFLNLSIMLCGTLLRWLLREAPTTSDPLVVRGTRLLLAVYLVVLPLASLPMIGFSRNPFVAYAIGTLLFLLVAGGRLRLQSRLTDWLGRISYSIYLFHPVVFLSVLWMLQRLPPQSAWRTQHLAVYIGVNLLLTLAVAAVVYRWVEQPGMRLGQRLARAVRERAAGAPRCAGVVAQQG